MSNRSFTWSIFAVSILLVSGIAGLNWLSSVKAEFEAQIVSSRHKSSVDELLGKPDYLFVSKKQMVEEIAGGNFVFKQLPNKSNKMDVHALPEIEGFACFYMNPINGDFLVYFVDSKIVLVYWAGT